MTQSYWQKYYDEVKVIGRDQYAHRRRPTDADCDAFEQQTGFKLPTDYREFIKVFGPGQFQSVLLEIKAPGFPDESSLDLMWWDSNVKQRWTPERAREEFEDWERATRMVYFMKSMNGDQIGWDPEDVRDAEMNEYGIYVINVEEFEIHELTGTFRACIQDFCLGLDFYRLMGWKEPPEFEDEPGLDGGLVPTRNFAVDFEMKDWRPG